MWTHASLCELLPHCTLSEQARVLEAPASMMTAQQHARMLRDGYYPVTASVGDATTRSSLLAGIEALVRAGLPASLIYTTDQAWRLSEAALALLPRHLDTQLTGDVLAWHVGPGTAGFAPHRDRQPDDVPSSFGPDGLPRYATLWLALTDVSSETSCLSVVPAACDPGYAAGDAVDDDAPTPLQVALPTKEAFQHIRALTGPAGSAWCFSHRTLHWGSANPPDSGAARISMSFVASDAAFEPSYLTGACFDGSNRGTHQKQTPLLFPASPFVWPLSARSSSATMSTFHRPAPSNCSSASIRSKRRFRRFANTTPKKCTLSL